MQEIKSTDIFEGDILKPFNDELTVTIANTKKHSKELERQIKLYAKLAEVAGKTAKSYAQIEAANKKQKQALTDKEKFDKKIIELERKKIELTDEMRKKLELLRYEEARRNKLAREQARMASTQTGAFEKLTLKIKTLSDQYRNLIALEGKETAETKRLRAEILALNRVRDTANENLGMHQNKVGQYERALGSLKNMLAQLGLAFGVFELLRSSFTILAEFDEKLADIAKTTGLSVEGARELSLELLKIDTRTSVTQLQELASAAGRLGIEGKDNIIGFATAADKVFVALGDDLKGTAEEIATGLGKISALAGFEAEFGIEGGIERVGSMLNELASSSKASAGAIFDFLNRTAGISSVAGIAVEDMAALGALFDSTGQSVEVAATTLNTLLPALSSDQERFAKVAGLTAEAFGDMLKNAPIEALKAVAIGAKSGKGGLDGLVESLGDFGVDSSRAASIVGVLASSTEELTRLQNESTQAVIENTSVQNEFNTKNDTLNASVEKLKKKWQELVIEWSNGKGVGEQLKDVIKFLTDNLETIINVAIAGVKAWASYKVAMSLFRKEIDANGESIAVGLIPNIINLGKSMLSSVRGITSVRGAFTTLGTAIRSIPFAGLVSFLVTVGPLLLDFASSLFDSAENTSALAKATDEANSKINEEKAGMMALFEQLKQTNAGSKERADLINQINSTYGTTLQNLSDEKEFARQVAIAYAQVNAELTKKIKTEVYQEKLAELIKQELELRDALEKSENQKEGLLTLDYSETFKEGLRKNKAEQQAFLDEINNLNENISGGKGLGRQKLTIEEEIKTTSDDKEKDKKEKTAEQLKVDELTAYKKQKALELLEYENDLILKNVDREQIDELKAQRKIELERQVGEKIIELDFENKETLIEHENDYLTEVEKARTAYLDEWVKDEEDLTDKILDQAQKRAQEQIRLAEIQREKEKKQTEELYAKIRQEISETNDLIQANLQKNLDGIDSQIEKQKTLYEESKSREQELKEIAKEKNLDASESIAFERDQQKKAFDEQAELTRKKQQIEALIAFLNAYAGKISQGEGNPIANIKSDILNAKSFIEGNFYKGTDTTIADALGYKSGRDSHIVAVDNDEAVFNPKLTAEMGIGRGRTTQDVADIIKMFDNANGSAMTVKENSPIIVSKFDPKAIQLLEKMAENTTPSNVPTGKNEFDVITGVLTYQAKMKGRKETVKYRVRK